MILVPINGSIYLPTPYQIHPIHHVSDKSKKCLTIGNSRVVPIIYYRLVGQIPDYMSLY